MEQKQDDQQAIVTQIYNLAANLMINEKKSAHQTRKILIENGLDAEIAQTVVSKLDTQISKAKKEKANKDMIFGALWCVGGLIVTIVTYQAASGGGSYIVAWGAIIFGAVQFIRGMINASE